MDIVGERYGLAHVGVEIEERELVFGGEESLGKVAGSATLWAEVFAGRAAGIDGEHNRERDAGLLLKVGDGLRLAVFREREVGFSEVGDGRAMRVRHVDEQTDEANLHFQGFRRVVGLLSTGAGGKQECAKRGCDPKPGAAAAQSA
jgi:hypothetical protein